MDAPRQSIIAPPASVQPPHSTVPGDFATAFKQLFEMSRQWSVAHANIPDAVKKDVNIPKELKERIISVTGAEAASFLLGNNKSRFQVVATLINQWLVKHVLKLSCFRSFDDAADARIDQLRTQLNPNTTQARRTALFQIVGELIAIQSRPNFRQFREQLQKDRANQLWDIVAPLMHGRSTRGFPDILQLMQVAFDLAVRMASGTFEWFISFPQLGAILDLSRHDVVDPTVRGDVRFLLARGCTVRLSITPFILSMEHIINSSHQQVLLTNTVWLSDVFIKIPQPPPRPTH